MKKQFTAVIVLLVVAVLCGTAFAAKKKAPAKMETPKPVGEKPDIQRFEPRGIERGIETTIHLIGTNLLGITEIRTGDKQIKAHVTEGGEKNTEAWVAVTAEKGTPLGAYDLSVVNAKGESKKVKIYVDDLPQFYESSTNKMQKLFAVRAPCSFWGTLEPAGDGDEVAFEAKAGENLVFDLTAKMIGSKANIMITLTDDKGNPLASNNSFDGGDPLLAYTVTTSGRYHVRIDEEQMGGSADHYYRLSIGALPVVVGGFPLSIKTNQNAEIELIGYNLPANRKTTFKAEKAGEMEVPVDKEKFRVRKPVNVLVTDENESIETEPNDAFSEATEIHVPAIVSGRIWREDKTNKKNTRVGAMSHADVDLFRFDAKKGQVWMIETDAARRGSAVDTKVEVLHPDGKPVERVLLQATRDSYINFRPIDSMSGDVRVFNWQEMELNELMYLEGEVCKIFRMPEGPDSGFQYYRNNGKRICYFDTSATAHANESPAYTVEPHPPGTQLVPNGLPTFTIYYANDDDAERELGIDSRLQFTAPADGTYLIRVTDNRGISGERLAYRLIVRPAMPDFKVTLNNAAQTIPPGSAQEFTVSVDRIDGFDEDITLDISDVPNGFLISKPIFLQAGHLQASGTIWAAPDAKEPAKEAVDNMKVTSTAVIAGKKVTKDVNGFTQLKIGEKPKLLVAIEPYSESNTNFNVRSITDKPMEITVTPGETVPAWLKVKREGHEDIVTFTVENLPHGVIVDNIGLNGVLIPKGEMERQIFLKCAKWVPEMDRLAYCQAKQAGNPTSFPVLIHVRRHGAQTASK